MLIQRKKVLTGKEDSENYNKVNSINLRLVVTNMTEAGQEEKDGVLLTLQYIKT